MKMAKKMIMLLTCAALTVAAVPSVRADSAATKTVHVVEEVSFKYDDGSTKKVSYSYNKNGMISKHTLKIDNKLQEYFNYTYNKHKRISKLNGKYADYDTSKKLYKFSGIAYYHEKNKNLIDNLDNEFEFPFDGGRDLVNNNYTFEWKNGLLFKDYNKGHTYYYNNKKQVIRISAEDDDREKPYDIKLTYDSEGLITKAKYLGNTVTYSYSFTDGLLTEVKLTNTDPKRACEKISVN